MRVLLRRGVHLCRTRESAHSATRKRLVALVAPLTTRSQRNARLDSARARGRLIGLIIKPPPSELDRQSE